jgi:hypothetical protein
MIKSIAASLAAKQQAESERARKDRQAALDRDRQLEQSSRPKCSDCGVIQGCFTRRGRNDTVSRPATFALCNYCFGLAEPLTAEDRVDRRLAVMRALVKEMRSRR